MPGMESTPEMFDLRMSEGARPLFEKVVSFVRDEVEPVTAEFFRLGEDRADRWSHTPAQLELLESVKAKAKAEGLWNFFLPDSRASGEGLNNLDYAYIADRAGQEPHRRRSVSTAPPRTPATWRCSSAYGTPEQKKQWLEPLLNGEIRSAYAMTEPGLASSDAKNIACQARARRRRVGDQRREVLHLRRRRSALQDHDHHGQDRAPTVRPPAAVADPGAPSTRRASRSSGPCTCSARTMRPTATCTSASTTCRVPKENILLGIRARLRDLAGAPGPRPHPPLHALHRAAERAIETDGEAGLSRRGLREADRPAGQEHRGHRQGPHRDRRPCG